jgi:hypothetical protein
MKKSFLFVSLVFFICSLLSVTISGLAESTSKGGYWGVYLEDLTEDIKKKTEFKGEGVFIQGLVDDSPAEEAGFKEGDIVIEVDGKKVTDQETLRKMIREAKPGAKMSVSVMRKGKKVSLSITVGEQEAKEMSIQLFGDKEGCDTEFKIGDNSFYLSLCLEKQGFLGICPQKMSDQLMEYFGVKGGALVGEVVKESPAEKVGIKAGDIVVEFDSRRVDDVKDLKYFLKKTEPGQKVPLKIIRKGQEMKFEVELGKCEDCKFKCGGEECEGECEMGVGLDGIYGNACKLYLDECKLKELKGFKRLKELEKLKNMQIIIEKKGSEENKGEE